MAHCHTTASMMRLSFSFFFFFLFSLKFYFLGGEVARAEDGYEGTGK